VHVVDTLLHGCIDYVDSILISVKRVIEFCGPNSMHFVLLCVGLWMHSNSCFKCHTYFIFYGSR
jgi:hypothetical protein